MLVKHYPTLLDGVGRCLISVVLDAGVFKRIEHRQTMLDFSTRHEIMALFLITRTKMLDEKFEQNQTSFNIVQHRPILSNMFDCAVQTGQTRPTMFDQHV